MSSFGRRSIFKSKYTIGIFLLLAAAELIPRFVAVPFLGLLTLPANMVYSMTGLSGMVASIGGGQLVSDGALLAFYYVFALVFGLVLKKLVGRRSTI